MFHALPTRRMTAAVLVASLIGVGAAAAQSAPTVTITNSGSIPVSINIPSLKDYREDLKAGETKSIPASNLAGVSTTNNYIKWEARLRDLSSTSQPRSMRASRIRRTARSESVTEVSTTTSASTGTS